MILQFHRIAKEVDTLKNQCVHLFFIPSVICGGKHICWNVPAVFSCRDGRSGWVLLIEIIIRIIAVEPVLI